MMTKPASLAASLVTAVVLAGCSGGADSAGADPGPARSAEPGAIPSQSPPHHPGLVGKWKYPNEEDYVTFAADGTLQLDDLIYADSPMHFKGTWHTTGAMAPSYDDPLLLTVVLPDGGGMNSAYEVVVLDSEQWVGRMGPQKYVTLVAVK